MRYNTGMERMSAIPSIDKVVSQRPEVIIVLGSGLHTSNASSNGKLSFDERMRLYAGQELLRRMVIKGDCPSFIFTGGKIYENFPELSTIARDITTSIGVDPKSKLHTVGGTNTLSDIELAIRCMQTNGYTRGIVISNEYHHVAKLCSFRNGLMYLSAEDVLIARNPKYRRIINDLKQTRYYYNNNIIQAAMALTLLLTFGIGDKFYLELSDKNGLIATENDPYKLKKMVEK